MMAGAWASAQKAPASSEKTDTKLRSVQFQFIFLAGKLWEPAKDRKKNL